MPERLLAPSRIGPTRVERPAEDLSASFEHFYRTHADRVYGFCLRSSGDRVAALELAQDVFVHIWEQFASLKDAAHAEGWVWRVASRVVANDRRGTRRRLARVAPSWDVEAAEEAVAARMVDPFATPPPLRRMALRTAIGRLPPRTAAVFVLHEIEGFSTVEIAAQLGVTESTVRVQLARARERLREMLRP